MPLQRAVLAMLACASALNAHASQPLLAPTPSVPAYGQQFQVQLFNPPWPYLLPTLRYWVTGNTINLDYESSSRAFAPMPANIGEAPVSFGEMAAGNYTVNARIYDLDNPSAPPQMVSGSIPVLPPADWGIYAVPSVPHAFSPWRALVRSAVFYDTASLRTSVNGGVIRVDFDYYADAPIAGAPPAGSTSYGSIAVPGLAPGNYRLEGWGRPKSGGDPVRYFTRDVAVGMTSPVIEFYSENLDHYFMSAGPGEIAAVDNDPRHPWKRTGQRWSAWLRASDAPPGAMAVYRFYSAGPNSHFYTADPAEMQYLRSLEASQRADAQAAGVPFMGYQYEGIAFYALVPVSGQCPGGTDPVYRAYNGRGNDNDANHRFMPDSQQRAATLATWVDEGVAFCSPR